MEEKDDKKMARRRFKEMRKEFFEANGYVELDPKASMRRCCAEAFDGFDAQTHEAWLMQCPKGMDPQKLVGKRIKLPGRRYIGDLQVRASNYETPLNEAVGYVNSKGKYALRKLPITGYVVVSKRLNTNKPVEQEGHDPLGPGSEFPAAPPPPKFNLPVRHPFFGRDYKKRIELSAPIAKALKKADKKHAETAAKLQRTANYYTIKSKMMKTTQTLEEKELEVRQSVLTGIRPKFMSSTAAPSMLLDSDRIVGIKQEPEENGVVQMNGSNLVIIKEEPTTPKKQKKRKSKGEIHVNATSNLQDSLVTIKKEPESESPPEKKKKRKKNKSNEEILLNGTSNLQDSLVTIKVEPESESQPEKQKKQKKNKSKGEIPVNGTSNLQDSLVTIKVESESESPLEKKKKHKKNKSKGEVPVNGTSNLQDSLVTIKVESESESPPEKQKKQKKNKSKGEIPVNGTSNLQDSLVTIKVESESESPPEKQKKQKKNKSKGEILVNGTLQNTLVNIEEEPESKSASEEAKKHKKRKSNEEILVNSTSDLHDSLVTIKEESESPPEKQKKRKRARGESVSIVAESAPQKKKKKLKAAA